MRSFFGFIILIIAFFGLVSFVNWIKRPGPVGCAFTLTSSNNTPVTEKDIRAKPAVVFFGYTMCPDVCPTTMQDMEVWIKQLGKDADKLGWWFFSVDPEHDTPEVMHDYLSSLPHNIVGITPVISRKRATSRTGTSTTSSVARASRALVTVCSSIWDIPLRVPY